MRIAITGASGLLGRAIADRLSAAGHVCVPIVRGKAKGEEVDWSPEENWMDASALEGFDAVVHLAGEGIADGRWNAAKKRRILESREKGTRLLAETLAALEAPPRVLVSASAVGFYGSRPGEVCDEDSPSGEGFLPRVCRRWETAAEAAQAFGVRTVRLRFGAVLSKQGGALAKMLPVFRLGLGGRLGSGRQGFSWITLEDATRAVEHLLSAGTLKGPVNVTAPNPVDNATFTRALGRALHRPAVLPVPAFAVRLAFGEMGQALLLEGVRAAPKRLLADGFVFRHPEIDGALEAVLAE